MYRTVWISDVHLGFKGCQADALVRFLKTVECEQIYLVGDIIDIWNMKRGLYWPQAHNNVLRTLLGMAKKGTRVIYVPGNHDEIFRAYNGMHFGNVQIRTRTIHTTADGKRLLVLHGDEFDSVIKSSPILAHIGNFAYDQLLDLNYHINKARKWMGKPYWSLAGYLKYKVKNAVSFISKYEETLASAARHEKADGIVCGHIHHAEISMIKGVHYYNTGDWVESCTALVEDAKGNITLLRLNDYAQHESSNSGTNHSDQAA